MKAIILTAGKGERMQPLSFEKQKHLLRLLGKTILEHDLDQLNGLVKEVILVIRPDGKCRAIKELIGRRYKDLKIEYAIQKRPLGTGDAAKAALPLVKDRFLLLNGDDLYCQDDIKNVLKRFPSLLAKEVEQPQFFGVVEAKRGIIKSFIEKPQRPKSKLVNTGLYFLPREILNYSIKKSPRGEYEFTDYIKQFIKEYKLYVSKAEQWVPISFCWNLLEANKHLLEKIEDGNLAEVEDNCKLSGKIITGEGTVIRKGTHIEGPVWIGKNCEIGKNSFLRKFTSIADNSKIEKASTIENSAIGSNTIIGEDCVVSNSVIGDKCLIEEKVTTIAFNEDGTTIKTKIKGQIVDTKRKKLGTILGDRVRIGAGTVIEPGVKVWPGKAVSRGERIEKDINNDLWKKPKL